MKINPTNCNAEGIAANPNVLVISVVGFQRSVTKSCFLNPTKSDSMCFPEGLENTPIKILHLKIKCFQIFLSSRSSQHGFRNLSI